MLWSVLTNRNLNFNAAKWSVSLTGSCLIWYFLSKIIKIFMTFCNIFRILPFLFNFLNLGSAFTKLGIFKCYLVNKMEITCMQNVQLYEPWKIITVISSIIDIKSILTHKYLICLQCEIVSKTINDIYAHLFVVFLWICVSLFLGVLHWYWETSI